MSKKLENQQCIPSIYLTLGHKWWFTHPFPKRFPAALFTLYILRPPPCTRFRLHHQPACRANLALVFVYVHWHAISCFITFTCQTVHQAKRHWWVGMPFLSHCPQVGSCNHTYSNEGDQTQTFPGVGQGETECGEKWATSVTTAKAAIII